LQFRFLLEEAGSAGGVVAANRFREEIKGRIHDHLPRPV
jgi:hypothetical protein